MPGSKRKFALLKKLNRLAPVWIACLCAMSLIYTWNHDWGNHQKPVEVSAGILLVSFGVMLVWLLLLSGYRFLKRILIAGALASKFSAPVAVVIGAVIVLSSVIWVTIRKLELLNLNVHQL